MSEILFIAHRVPFPPDRGDKIRSHHLLKALARLAPVHVACMGDDDADMAQASELGALAASHCLVRRAVPLPLAGVHALATGRPVSLTAFSSPRLRTYVDNVLETQPISAIFVFSGQMAQYVPAGFAGTVVMDFVDVDSAKFEAYAASAGLPQAVLYGREARLLARYEELVARRVSASLFVTPQEVALFASRFLQGPPPRLMALANGIDTDLFDPATVRPAPDTLLAGPQIVFTGQMDYPPNVEAVHQFACGVMPRIRAVHPHAEFNVVGRAPADAVRALHGVNGTRVTGAVPDTRPWIAGADLVVAPLLLARGVQNKVLEAMAMARPVLLTTAAATGIDAVDGRDFAIADGVALLSARALALLGDAPATRAMGQAARAFVRQNCAWDSVLAPLPAMLGFEQGHARDAA